MKKMLALLLAAVMILGMAACAKSEEPAAPPTEAPTEAPQETVGMANPVTTVNSYAELCEISPEVLIQDAPEGSTNVVYSWIQNIPVIKQIDFNFGGHDFTLRAVLNTTGTITTDISGVTTPMDAASSVAVGGENVAGGTYILEYNTENGSGIASWVSTLNSCQYSLYTPTGCKDFQINKVIEAVYTCTLNAKQVSGTVLMVTGKTLTLTLDNGDTVVLDCSAIGNIQVQPDDVVAVDYTGDLKGAAQALKIVTTGHREGAKQVSGVLQVAEPDTIFLRTTDGNVYLFHVTAKTKITGVAARYSKNDEVQVTYEGNLGIEDTYALEIKIEKVVKEDKPDPSTDYVNRSVSGYITSVAGNYICVNGKTFYIDKSTCTVSGTMKVDYWADLSYREYTNGKTEAYKAVFTNKSKQDDYTLRTIYGTITSLTESTANRFYKMVVNGNSFVVHYNTIYEGNPRMGDAADLHYKDYGNGKFEVTEARFYENSNPQWEWCQVYGTVTKISGSNVYIDGKKFFVPNSVIYDGTPIVNGTATLYVKVYTNGNQEVDEAHFFDPEPTPITYTDVDIYGTVDSIIGNTMRVQGMSIQIPTRYSGTPMVGGTVDMTERQYSDGSVEVIYCTFYAPPTPEPTEVTYEDVYISGSISSISGSQMRVQGMNITIPDRYTGYPEVGGSVELVERQYSNGDVEIIRCAFYPAPPAQEPETEPITMVIVPEPVYVDDTADDYYDDYYDFEDVDDND